MSAAVAATTDRSPQKLTRKRSAKLRVPQSTMQDHMKEVLNLKPYRPTFTNELSDVDMNRRHDACRALLDTFPNIAFHSKVLFTDECTIYRSTRDRNVVFWTEENLHFTVDMEHNPPHVMLWAGMTATHLIGSFLRWTC
jgi:hypothetical protein